LKVSRGSGKTPEGGGSKPSPVSRKEGEPSFVEAITEAKQGAVNRDRDELVTRIEEQARTLVKTRTVTEMTKYRELIAEFMKKVVGESFEMKEIPSARYVENNKVFVVAQKIQETLLDLAEKIRAGTAEALAITAATSEIRGLLLDIVT